MPATKEPVVGNVEFYFVGQGKKFEGKTSLAEKWIAEENFKKIEDLPGYRDKVKEKIRRCFFYAQRSKGVLGKRLFVSTRNILKPKFHDSFKNVFAFPYGWIDKFRVPCEGGEWGKSGGWEIYSIKPLDTETWASGKGNPLASSGTMTHEELKALGEIAINITSAAKNRAEIKAAKNAEKAANKRNKQLLDKVQELAVENDELKQQLQAGGPLISKSGVMTKLVLYVFAGSLLGLLVSPFLAQYEIAKELCVFLGLIVGTVIMFWREK